MSKKSLTVFISIFALSYLLLSGLFRVLENRQSSQNEKEIRLIHESIKDRFKIFLASPLTISLVGAQYFAKGKLEVVDYGIFSEDVLTHNREILGLTVINADGKIVRVFPERTNRNTLGKTTQHIKTLKASFEKKEKYWLSHPFELYQGQRGFAFYTPILEDGELKGWFASIISSKEFFDHFRLAEYLKSFELVIRDQLTDEAYFASASDQGITAHVSKATIENRDLVFKYWAKSSTVMALIPWYVSLLFCLLIAALASMINHQMELRKLSRLQLGDIRSVLRMTAKEAVTKLVDLRTDKKQDQKELTYLSNLVEQIDLLQTMSNPETELETENYELLPLVESELSDMQEVIEKKRIKVLFDSTAMRTLNVVVNERLVQSGVIHHVLIHLLVFIREHSTLEILHQEKQQSYELVFHALEVTGPEAFQTDRRFEVAKKVMHICGGELSLENHEAKGLLIRIVFPIRLRVEKS